MKYKLVHKRVYTFIIALLSVVGYGAVVFGAQLPAGTTPPSGGYAAGDSILDPGCAPGDTGCFQNIGGAGGGWALTGNAGTDSSTDFIGTSDYQDFVVKTNNSEVARFA